MLTLDRGGDFRCGSRWQAAGYADAGSSTSSISPDSLGDLYGARDGAARLRAREPTSTRSSGSRPPATTASRRCSCDILCLTDAGPRIDRCFFSTERAAVGRRLQPELLRAARSEGRRARFPDALRAHVAARRAAGRRGRRASAGRRGRESLPGGRAGLERAAGVGAGDAVGFENVFVQPAAGNAGTAIGAVLDAWHGPYRQTAACGLAIDVPRAGLTARTRSSRCWRTASCASSTW